MIPSIAIIVFLLINRALSKKTTWLTSENDIFRIELSHFYWIAAPGSVNPQISRTFLLKVYLMRWKKSSVLRKASAKSIKSRKNVSSHLPGNQHVQTETKTVCVCVHSCSYAFVCFVCRRQWPEIGVRMHVSVLCVVCFAAHLSFLHVYVNISVLLVSSLAYFQLHGSVTVPGVRMQSR